MCRVFVDIRLLPTKIEDSRVFGGRSFILTNSSLETKTVPLFFFNSLSHTMLLRVGTQKMCVELILFPYTLSL